MFLDDCAKDILELQSKIEKIDKSNKSVQKQMLIQLTMLNNSNIKICKSIEKIDQKLQVIMKADSRIRNLALPIPSLPPAFINILPAKTMEEVATVESLLSDDNSIHYIEELVSKWVCKYTKYNSTNNIHRFFCQYKIANLTRI